ncbi:MAG: hypothetical protein LLG00_07465 [Planctomycetaceae bacterium]|nr:hypothetical protein [Planctomycetaceae bacterium]
MQLLSALLAGFFFWLMLFRSSRRRLARAREEAGQLLLEVRNARWFVYGFFALRISIIALACIQGAQILWLWSKMQGGILDRYVLLHSISFYLSLFAAAWMGMLMICAFPPQKCRIAFEVRRNGVVWQAGLCSFVPWNDIDECRWCTLKMIRRGFWSGRILRRFSNGRMTIFERDIASGQKEAVTAAIGRFVPVADADGTLLVQLERAVAPISAAASRAPAWWRFQFDLQSLMLLVVVASCIASNYGMHYRRLQPQREAIARLQSFPGSVTALNDVVAMLDFSKCPRKPGDADLVCLEPLEDLSSLDLSGAPITDAGLVHLKRLHRLELLRLSNCAITDAGLSNLHGLLRLDFLDLSHCAITDTGLVNLRDIKGLHLLILSGCPITDAGLPNLEKLNALHSLSLTDTQVTANGAAKLHRALPNAKIYFGPSKKPTVVEPVGTTK